MLNLKKKVNRCVKYIWMWPWTIGPPTCIVNSSPIQYIISNSEGTLLEITEHWRSPLKRMIIRKNNIQNNRSDFSIVMLTIFKKEKRLFGCDTYRIPQNTTSNSIAKCATLFKGEVHPKIIFWYLFWYRFNFTKIIILLLLRNNLLRNYLERLDVNNTVFKNRAE